MTAFNPPTGVLLGQYVPGTEEWEKARAGLCITATEIAAVLDVSPWSNPFVLWHKKSGLPVPPFVVTPQVEWGNRLEPAVAQKFADEHPEIELSETGTWRHRDREWQRATPDRVAADRLLEVKTSPTGEGWEKGVPLHYYCQIQWQLDTLGLSLCHVAVLISGHDYREFTVEHDPADAKTMRAAAELFLDSVRNGDRPDIDSSPATYETLRRQADRFDDIDVEIPGPIASRYEVTHQQLKASETEHQHAKSLLLDALGNGRNAMHLGRRVAYRTAHEDGSTRALQPSR
ncbi:YqaJ viral recombinase family protein [Streptomyces sp. NRRL S-15]|uniref:YqaJ viral recombinase family nuclease n=1 Tax=Streptomyces sp. NRRL S-15 TaxID=1463886 RepID=UPI0004C9FF57|nr:YqaJ viral recombinase family protein [Streptomyces sp. NRRL S-15]